MSRSEICPTCGTKLGPTHPRAAMRVCTSCQRSNPEGFSYCGFCASPMENTEMRARMTELAAPPGGWPNITSELVEVRFYLQQGLLDDAYELLSIMQKRHPGHPQLSELVRRPKPSKRVDTGVLALVDTVLAESANLVAKVPRRAAPQFQAPSPGSPNRTDVHAPVEPAARSSSSTRARTGKTGSQPTSAPAPKPVASPSPIESSRAARTASNAGTPRTTTRAPSGSQSAPTGPQAQAQARSEGEPIPVARERTRIYRTVDAPGAVRQAPPIAVPPSSASTRAASGSHPTTPETAGPAVSGSIASRSSGAHTPVAAQPVPRVRIDPPKGGTQIRPVPQTGNTMVVDALQPAAPFAGGEAVAEGDEADGAIEAEANAEAESAVSSSRRARGEKRRRRNADAPAAKPAPAPAPAPSESATAGASPDAEESPRRRRTTFGEHVLNRLR
ncbi:MAG: hypothetical protein IPH07_32005 [Deltaproteobacteria bacterium]|nr:hypothetical protein [Deltaproteobacteria bacterium]MBK8715541.1 hypothetical protein [Deltaproteobacteria bacterium]MBP7288441.1 hypothetical protein [Nannocystaceae bacterium]